LTIPSVGGTASFDDAHWPFRANSPQAICIMTDSEPMISRMSIFIFSYFLVNAGVSNRLPPAMALTCVLFGTIGFVAYFAFEWSASIRCCAVRE
jgi:hypothetical protein